MDTKQPKPDSKKYSNLISEIESGKIKIPKFQREFVWSIEKTANLLDSILKGYPIGTFILWETDERLNHLKNVGNLTLPDPPDREKIQYILDGQQRITSLFAAYCGAKIQKAGEKKITDYANIVVNLDDDLDPISDPIVTAEPSRDRHIPLSDILNARLRHKEIRQSHSEGEIDLIFDYELAFRTYDFSTIVLLRDDIDSAIEVFTRINTGGQTLTLFEIMSAKTYDEKQNFDMQEKWSALIDELKDVKYEGISSTVILSLLSLIISDSKECKRKTILGLDKQDVIDRWDDAIDAIKHAIDYFITVYRIPVSSLLPYDSLIVPFAYYFYRDKDKPEGERRALMEEFFWRVGLSQRYSSATESKLAQDIKRVERIIAGERPDYSDIRIALDSPETLIETNFSAGNSYCKTVLCLLAYQEPKDFIDNARVVLDNGWLKMANSKNYHHFFPRAYLRKVHKLNENSLMNITFVSDRLNKRKIGAKAPSQYIGEFAATNTAIEKSLESHLISLDGFGIESDDYEVFLKARASRVFDELKKRLTLDHDEPEDEELREFVGGGEGQHAEFKSSLRFDIQRREVNKKLEYGVAKTVAAFMNADGGTLLIGVDDHGNAVGLKDDISTLGKQNLDGFDLKLNEMLRNAIGAENMNHVKVDFPEYDDVTICRVRVSKSGRPVFTRFEGSEEFYVRQGAASTPLNRKEQNDYTRDHW